MSRPVAPIRLSTGRRFLRPSARRVGLWATLVAVVALAVGCSASPGTEQDFVEVLSRNDYLTQDQAACIAEAVFAEYGDNPDVLGRLSGAGGDAQGNTQYDQLVTGENAIEGFDEFFTAAVNTCTPAGP